MSMSMSAALPAPGGTVAPVKGSADYPQKFEEITPGSRIRVTGSGLPFDATVLSTIPEFGPTSIPALTIAADHNPNEPMLVTASGQYGVTVIMDAAMLTSTELPDGARSVALRRVGGVAVQFKGGNESALNIVRWCVGHAIPQYRQPTDTEGDRLVFSGHSGAMVARVGDWVIIHEDGTVKVEGAGSFEQRYEDVAL